jgi:hypothetical protein
MQLDGVDECVPWCGAHQWVGVGRGALNKGNGCSGFSSCQTKVLTAIGRARAAASLVGKIGQRTKGSRL